MKFSMRLNQIKRLVYQQLFKSSTLCISFEGLIELAIINKTHKMDSIASTA